MDQNDEDIRILKRVRKGELSAMTELIDRYKTPLYGYLYRISRHECDDLFQETWLKVWENLRRFDINRPFKPWLFTLASNVFRDRWRKQKVREKYDKPAEDVNRNHIYDVTVDIRKALDDLPLDQKNTLVLRYYEGFTEKEIARIMKCPQGTVKTRVFQAIRKLREKLKNNE